MSWTIVLFQWIMSQFLKGSYENWVIKQFIVVYSGFNTDYGSSEPLKTLVMLCYVMLVLETLSPPLDNGDTFILQQCLLIAISRLRSVSFGGSFQFCDLRKTSCLL